MRQIKNSSNDCEQLRLHRRLMGLIIGLGVCMSVLSTKPVAAQEFVFHAEPAVALWLDDPQFSRFTPGLYLALRPGIALNQVVALQWSYAMLAVGSRDGYNDSGSAHFFMGGIRLRPFATLRPEEVNLGGLFVDFNLGYVRTKELNRFGFDAGVGYVFQVASRFGMGPALRYGQIVQPADAVNQDAADAQFITVGLDFAFGPAYRAEEQCPDQPVCRQDEEDEEDVKNGKDDFVVAAAVPCTPCADDDRDGVCNADDECPDAIGPPATLGCPIDPCSGKPLKVLVQFKFDSAEMPEWKAGAQTMDPVLDAVAAAIAKDPSCRVCIIGHASEEGSSGHNMTLSSSRSSAVQSYMVEHGLNESRVPAIGMGERCQLIPKSTHVLNRRVEFRRLEEGQSCPTECTTR